MSMPEPTSDDEWAVEIQSVAESQTLTEFYVPLDDSPIRPEVALFTSIANWLAEHPDRVPIVAVSAAYIPADQTGGGPQLIGVLVTGTPVGDIADQFLRAHEQGDER